MSSEFPDAVVVGERVEGVGWVTQVMDVKGQWFSWTQWRRRKDAETQAMRLLEKPEWVAARVARVDWTVVSRFDGSTESGATDSGPDASPSQDPSEVNGGDAS